MRQQPEARLLTKQIRRGEREIHAHLRPLDKAERIHQWLMQTEEAGILNSQAAPILTEDDTATNRSLEPLKLTTAQKPRIRCSVTWPSWN